MTEEVYVCPKCDEDFDGFDEFFEHLTWCEEDEEEEE